MKEGMEQVIKLRKCRSKYNRNRYRIEIGGEIIAHINLGASRSITVHGFGMKQAKIPSITIGSREYTIIYLQRSMEGNFEELKGELSYAQRQD